MPVGDGNLKHRKNHRIGFGVLQNGVIVRAATHQQRRQSCAKGHLLFQSFGFQREVQKVALAAVGHGFRGRLEPNGRLDFQAQRISQNHILPVRADVLRQGHLQEGDAVGEFLAVELAFVLLHAEFVLVGGHSQTRFDGAAEVFVQGVQKAVELVEGGHFFLQGNDLPIKGFRLQSHLVFLHFCLCFSGFYAQFGQFVAVADAPSGINRLGDHRIEHHTVLHEGIFLVQAHIGTVFSIKRVKQLPQLCIVDVLNAKGEHRVQGIESQGLRCDSGEIFGASFVFRRSCLVDFQLAVFQFDVVLQGHFDAVLHGEVERILCH